MNRVGLYRIAACTILTFSTAALHAEDVAKPDSPKPEAPAADTPKPDAPKSADAPVIDPAAQSLISDVSSAYGKLKSLALVGVLVGDFDAAGQTKNENSPFTSTFEAPNKFSHNAKDGITFGSTGDKIYLYIKAENGYLTEPAPKEKIATRDMPAPFSRVISTQNPSLMLALAKDPAHDLIEDTTEISKIDDTKIGDVSYPTLKFVQKGASINVAIDSSTHLLRQAVIDVRSMLEQQGVTNVKKASYTIDYTTTDPDADVKADQFAWTPPAGSKDMKAAASAEAESAPANSLVGKEAPAVKLTGLDGKTVTLADLKGHVVVIDLWATWCPPCRLSLPHLDEFYQKNKQAGVMVYAVNEQEDKDKVSDFVTKTKLGVPVLLDSDGKVGNDYKASGIPETVVIGKDGKVVKVFIGFDPGSTPQELSKAVAEAMKK